MEQEESWDNMVERIAQELWAGKQNGGIDKPMVHKYASELMNAITEGFGSEGVSPTTKAFESIRQLHINVYHFSGAKNWNELREMSTLLTNNRGELASFEDFLKGVKAINSTYRVNYLESEYNHAVASAQMIGKWQQIKQEADVFPYLQYIAVMDGRTREEHGRMNDIVRPVNDPFWKLYYPPNGWNCRCTVSQLDEGDAEQWSGQKLPELPKLDKMFQTNVGETNVVYSDKHPYYSTIPKKAKKRIYTATEKMADGRYKNFTFKLPRQEQFLKVAETENVFEHAAHERGNDYKSHLQVAKLKSKDADRIELLPEVHTKELDARKKVFPGYKNPTSNPDLRIDNSYWDVKQTSPRNLLNQIKDGAEQCDNVVVVLNGKMNYSKLKSRVSEAFKKKPNLKQIDVVMGGKIIPFKNKSAPK